MLPCCWVFSVGECGRVAIASAPGYRPTGGVYAQVSANHEPSRSSIATPTLSAIVTMDYSFDQVWHKRCRRR